MSATSGKDSLYTDAPKLLYTFSSCIFPILLFSSSAIASSKQASKQHSTAEWSKTLLPFNEDDVSLVDLICMKEKGISPSFFYVAAFLFSSFWIPGVFFILFVFLWIGPSYCYDIPPSFSS